MFKGRRQAGERAGLGVKGRGRGRGRGEGRGVRHEQAGRGREAGGQDAGVQVSSVLAHPMLNPNLFVLTLVVRS